MTIQEIRQDLRDIRYYYSKKEQFDRASNIILPKALLEKIERYQKAMLNAPARLLDLYISLYVQNRSQAALAYEWNYSNDYIKQQNKQLCDYLLEALPRCT